MASVVRSAEVFLEMWRDDLVVVLMHAALPQEVAPLWSVGRTLQYFDQCETLDRVARHRHPSVLRIAWRRQVEKRRQRLRRRSRVRWLPGIEVLGLPFYEHTD